VVGSSPNFRAANVREVFVGSYRLIYRTSKDLVTVIAFIHGARDLAALLGRGEI